MQRKQQEENERRFLARQARLRERRQRKMNSLLLVSRRDSSDGSAVGDRRATTEGVKTSGRRVSCSERAVA
jgi:hypothetical protein